MVNSFSLLGQPIAMRENIGSQFVLNETLKKGLNALPQLRA